MKEHKCQAHNSFLYVTVYDILEWRDGAVYKTKKKGYAFKTRPKGDNEMYSSISTSITKHGGEITLKPWIDT